MALMIIIGYLVTSLVTFRYTGYMADQYRMTHHGEYTNICKSCVCDDCGVNRYGHTWAYGSCRNPDKSQEGWHGFHYVFATFFGGLMALFWPVALLGMGVLVGAKATGINTIQFFVPPPEIQTREERRARKDKEKDERMKALEKRNTELEKQLGISHG